jgi:hypothetical protein
VPWVLDSKELEYLSQYEGLFQGLLSRYSLSPSYWASHEMSTHVNLLFNFWKYKLITKNIHICFSFYAPHDPSSFSLYLVSKLLKVPYIFIDMPIAAQKIRFFSCSFKYRNLLIRNKKYETPKWAKEILENYQYKIKDNFESALPPFISISNKKEFINKVISSIKNGDFLKKVQSRLIIKLPSDTYFKYNRHEWYSDKAIPNFIIRYFEDIKISLRILKRKLNYNNLCSSFNNEIIGSNYIYFPAALSPEGSSIPTALWNRDIKIAILKLISAMPKDCIIVYKAGPLQFKKSYYNQFSTFPDWFTSNFYYDLLNTGRVKFVSAQTPTKNLIINSIGVASINGTASLEAIALGKQAIIFSPMWYDSLDGISYCKTQEDIESSIDSMKLNKSPKPNFKTTYFSSASAFENKDFIPNSFHKEIYKIIVKKFISSYDSFLKLDDKKWSI